MYLGHEHFNGNKPSGGQCNVDFYCFHIKINIEDISRMMKLAIKI